MSGLVLRSTWSNDSVLSPVPREAKSEFNLACNSLSCLKHVAGCNPWISVHFRTTNLACFSSSGTANTQSNPSVTQHFNFRERGGKATLAPDQYFLVNQIAAIMCVSPLTWDSEAVLLCLIRSQSLFFFNSMTSSICQT